MAVIDSGNDSAGKANVDAAFNLKTTLPTDPQYVGQVIATSSIDDGSVTGDYQTRTIDIDEDYKLRTGADTIYDSEIFNYTAQNTGKYSYANTTMAFAWTTAGLITNSGSITTTATGAQIRSYGAFPIWGATTIYVETQLSISAQPVSNTLADFGLGVSGAANPFTPLDGIYFRLNASGVRGVINAGGVEFQTAPFDFTAVDGSPSYTNSKKYQFTLQISERRVIFWINNVFMAAIQAPSGQARLVQAASGRWFCRHAIVGGAAGGVLQLTINSNVVHVGGPNFSDDVGTVGNRAFGSYQGLSGGTMGSLASYANSTLPAGAAGSNTAANITGLGGQGAINAAATAATDFIMCSYQVPDLSTSVQGRRLAVRGVKISLLNLGAAVATTATSLALSLCFGHTAVSLATTESATSKAPRRIALGFAFFPVGAVIGATPQNGDVAMTFNVPVYVNPGEFIAVAMKFIVGTATASQVINYHVTFDYGWE